MSTTDDTNPTPLPDRAASLLEQIEAAGGEWTASYATIATVCDLARSTAQLAAADLISSGLVTGTKTPAGTVYRRTAKVYRPPVPTRTDSYTDAVPSRYTDPAESVHLDAPPLARHAHDAPAQSPLPTPIEHGTATRTEGALRAPAPAREVGIPSEGVPTDGAVPTEPVMPIGRLAVAAMIEAASEAGRSVDARLRGRVGQAAQRMAADESVETILAAARRVGAGGFDDLYTAARTVKASAVRTADMADRTAELMPTGEVQRISPRIEATFRLIRATWPRAHLDAEVWEDKLGRIQERFLLAAVDALAKQGGEFAPTWGQVWKAAHEIGQPIVGAERAERAHQREMARLGPRYPR